MCVKVLLVSHCSWELGIITVYIFQNFPKRSEMQYGELEFLQEPAESSSCGEEEKWSFGAVFSKTARGNIFKCRHLSMHWCSPIQVTEVKPSHAVSLWLLSHGASSGWHLIDWEEEGFHVRYYKPIHLVRLSVILFEILQATVNSWVPGKAIRQDGPMGRPVA